MHSLTENIRRKGIELGFGKIGFARAERLYAEYRHLSEWLRAGYHAAMNWMSRSPEERIDPCNILPGAKTVISAALNYYSDRKRSEDTGEGKISMYAWGGDYHISVGRRLSALLEYIKSLEPSAQGKVVVDAGRIMEKVWAQRAGVGWQGKHTLTITDDYGSWVFLGEIILNLELDTDPPATDLCGDCSICIDSCPTNAIVEPYVLNSGRCISYLTIEHPDEISTDYTKKMDRWIFGCDICQDKCPWNLKNAKDSRIAEFAPRAYNISPPLVSLMDMKQEEYDMKYSESPIRRVKLERLKRNVRAALR